LKWVSTAPRPVKDGDHQDGPPAVKYELRPDDRPDDAIVAAAPPFSSARASALPTRTGAAITKKRRAAGIVADPETNTWTSRMTNDGCLAARDIRISVGLLSALAD